MHITAVHNDIQEILFTEVDIANRVRELGAQITGDYRDRVAAGERVVLVCVLRGAAPFMIDLARAIELPIEMEYMSASSYGNAAVSSGEVRIGKHLNCNVEGCHVLVVEDIIDTGLTLKTLMESIATKGPLSVESAAFLRKELPSQVDVPCKYVGFTCPDEFVVGYGLDYAERYRNLAEICVLKPEIYR